MNAPAARVSFRDWVAVLGAVLGAFMAVLDIQITNASLRDIQGGIAASVDEGSWISTGYLVAEIITIPLTGWLSEVFSTRRYLLVNCALFLVFSVLCGTATSLPEIVLFRIGQGFTGGVLIPMAFSIILRKLPPAKQPMGMALFGLTATFAPAIGPTIGGWLTETYSWHWIFYVNIVPGLALIWAIWYGLDAEPMNLKKIREADWAGIALMALGLGTLISVLEEGERKDWFTAEWIRYCTAVAAFCLPAFAIRELTAKRPLINLRLLGKRSLGAASVLGLIMGFGLYGSTYLLPVYLGQIQGYNAEQIGRVIMWAGMPQLALMPIVPWFMKRFDARLLVAFGFALFGISCLMNGHMSYLTAEPQLRLPQLVRALGQPFIIVPLSSLATAGIARADQAGASALFNIFRNLGGSFGIALLSTITTIREHYHYAIISERLTVDGAHVQQWLGRIGGLLGSGANPLPPLAQLQALVRREAFTMSYSDCFYGMGVALLLAILALAIMPRARFGGAAVAAH